jgi:diguanylate cyclase (GGDEF)-like protein
MTNLNLNLSTIINIADVFVENDPSDYLDLSTKLIAESFNFKGLLLLSLDRDSNKSLSTVFSYKGTPTSIVFEEEAFSSNFSPKDVLEIDHNHVDDIDEGDSSQKFNFYATSFGDFKNYGLVAIGFKDIKNHLKDIEKEYFSSMSQILGINFQNISIIRDDSIKITENFTKDPLTGLLNYKFFTESLAALVEEKKIKRFACIVIALDDFTAINSKYGFDLGNEVLFEIAVKIQKVVGKNNLIGRIGGDIFGIVLKNTESQDNFQQIINRISNIFRKGLLPVGKELTASIGITIFPDDFQENEDLITNAELASKKAKKIPGTHSAFYEEIKLTLK